MLNLATATDAAKPEAASLAEQFAAAEAAGDIQRCLELAALAKRDTERPRGSAPLVGTGRTWTVEELREKDKREAEAHRKAQRDAAEWAEAERWKSRGARDLIAEIERDGERRVFLADDGRVMVRGRGTPSFLRVALVHHAAIVRAILADREAVEELIPAPSAEAA